MALIDGLRQDIDGLRIDLFSPLEHTPLANLTGAVPGNEGLMIYVPDHTAGSGVAVSNGNGSWIDLTTGSAVA